MKPVKLEIFLQDGLTPGLKSAGKVLERFAGDSKAQFAEVSESLNLQKQYVSGLTKELNALEKAYKNATPGSEAASIKAQLNSKRAELENEKKGLQELSSMYDELKRKQSDGEPPLKMQLRSLREEIATLLVAYRSLSDEEKQTAQGRELSRHIDELTEKAGELNDVIVDTSQAVSNAASDTRGFDQLAGATQMVVDGFGLATAGAQMFGMSQESLVEAQTKLQSVLVASNALTSMQNNLQKQSALMQGVNTIQTKAAAMAETIKTAATGRGVIATKAATVAQAAFNAVAKANPYVLLAAAIVTVVGALWAYSAGTKDAKKSTEEVNNSVRDLIDEQKRAETQAERVKAAHDSISSTMVNERAELELNIAKTRDFNGTKEQEKSMVEQLNNKYGETMGYFSSVADWYNALIKNSEAYCRQMVIEARTRALANQIAQAEQDNYNIRYDDTGKARKYSKTRDVEQYVSGYYTPTTGGAGGGPKPQYSTREIPGTSDLDKANAAIDANNAKISNLKKQMQGLAQEAATMSFAVQGSPVKPQTSTTPKTTSKGSRNTKDDEKARLEAEKRIGEELLNLQGKNRQNEIDGMEDGLKKKLAQIQYDYDRQISELQEMEDKWRTAQKGNLTEEQEAALTKGRALAKNTYTTGITDANQEEQKKIAEQFENSMQKWDEYLMAYGDFQQKKEATVRDYNRRIAKAETEGERASLKKEMEATLKGLKFDELKADINLADVFGDVSLQSTESLNKLRDKLAAYINGAAKDLKPEDLKALQDAFRNIDEAITGRSPFAEFRRDMGEYKDACDAVKVAQENLDTVINGGKVYVEEYNASTGQTVKKLLTQEEAERRLTKAQNDRYTKLAQVNKSLNAGVAEARSYLEIANSISGMLTDFGIQLPEEINGVIEGFGTILDGLESIDLMKPASIITGLAKTIGGIGKTMANILTLGGIDFGGQKSKRRYEEAKQQYESYMAVLDKVIDKQLKLVETMTSTDWLNADNSYRYAQSLITKQEESARILGRQYLNAGASSGFLGIGSSASHGVEQRKGMSGAGWNEYNSLKGQTDKLREVGLTAQQLADAVSGRMTGLFDMTAEQLQWIMTNAPTFWAQLHSDTRTYLEQIIECGDAWDDLLDSRRQSLTKVTFDEFYSNWLDTIKDMSADVDDVAEDIEESFREAIFSSLMDDRYKEKIRQLYNRWADMMESDGELSQAEIEILRRERDELAQKAIEERNSLAETFGWKREEQTSQSGKSGSFNAISQDQGTKLEGLFVSVQGHVANIDYTFESVADKMAVAEGHLSKIENNTGESAEHLENIKRIITEIAIDGLRTR